MDAHLPSRSSSRPSKVRRVDQGDNLSVASSTETTKLDLYFDTLDDNGLDHVAKYLWAKAWPSFPRAEDIIPLLYVHGELGSFLQCRCFHTLRIAFEPDFRDALKKGTIFTTDVESALKFAILAGECLRTILIELDYIFEPEIEWDTAELAAAFSIYCPNVRSLEINAGSSQWVKEFGCQLEGLSLTFPPDIVDIERNCPRVRHIKLRLSDSYRDEIVSSNIWEKIGGTLESMKISFGWPCGDEIGKIEKDCRALTRIEISKLLHHPMQTSEYLQLLSSYGGQLEFAAVCDFTENELKAVVEACPNARYKLDVKQDTLLPALDILGRHLETAVIHNSTASCDQEELGRAWRSCCNVKEIWFFTDSCIAEYRALFLHPKPSLKKIQFMPVEEHLTEIMDLIARGTGSLEELEIETDEIPSGDFDALVESNQHLRCARIVFPFESVSSRKVRYKTAEITKSLLQAPSLNSLYLGDQESTSAIPKRLWKTLARRGIDFCTEK